jgi:DNA polymerase III subunit delta'
VHAYLFSGPAEVGKFTASKFFANLILCGNQACGECEICRQIRANIFPQLTIASDLWIEGVNEDLTKLAKKSNFNQLHRTRAPKAKTDSIGRTDLQEILARVNEKYAGYKIFIVKNIERMTIEAANYFLKTLEEPPKQTIFLLTTSNQPQVLSTIISRCRVLNFGNVNSSVIEEMLKIEFPLLDETERARIVNFAMGKPVRAARLAQDPDIFREFGEYFQKLKNLFEKPNLSAKMKFAEIASANALETQKFLEALTYFLRSFLLTRARESVVNSRYSVEKLVKLIRATGSVRNLILRNVNARLALENLLFLI